MSRQREIITGYVGPMFAMKTLLLIHDITAGEAVGETVVVYKPSIDDRYGPGEIRSRAGGYHPAIAVSSSTELLKHLSSVRPAPRRVAIDEVQFFDPGITDVVLHLAEHGYPVVYSALIQDFRGDPFGPVRDLLPVTINLHRLAARCMYSTADNQKCGADAQMTQRLINALPAPYDSPQVIIEKPGTTVTYEARCLDHWQVPGLPQRVNLDSI